MSLLKRFWFLPLIFMVSSFALSVNAQSPTRTPTATATSVPTAIPTVKVTYKAVSCPSKLPNRDILAEDIAKDIIKQLQGLELGGGISVAAIKRMKVTLRVTGVEMLDSTGTVITTRPILDGVEVSGASPVGNSVTVGRGSIDGSIVLTVTGDKIGSLQSYSCSYSLKGYAKGSIVQQLPASLVKNTRVSLSFDFKKKIPLWVNGKAKVAGN